MHKLKKARMRFVAFNGKVADISHADINKHEITLAAMGLPTQIVAMIVATDRVAGTGNFDIYPNEGTVYIRAGLNFYETVVAAIRNERLQYSLSVANDDFDLMCFGYWVI